jgi:predicted PurR-regulated permease PerM
MGDTVKSQPKPQPGALRHHRSLHQKFFYWLLLVVSLALCWVLSPFFHAIFWGTILAIIFQPVQRALTARFGGRRNLAALLTLGLCVMIVIVPLALVTASLVQEGTLVYQQIKSGEWNIGAYFEEIVRRLPDWARRLLARVGLTDIGGLQRQLSAGAAQISQVIATQALSIGQNTFRFMVSFGVMLYLLFFLLRDGAGILRKIGQAAPLDAMHKQHLMRKFTTVVRATVKGNVAVALVQGALGGLAFWALGIHGALLWGVLMAFLSLLPAIGAALVWAPVGAYLLLTGALWKGIGLIAFCALVIGLVDNMLRPVLVGKDTRLPDWVVLISTLGGMALFGINGFVIGPLIAALFIACWDLFVQSGDAGES